MGALDIDFVIIKTYLEEFLTESLKMDKYFILGSKLKQFFYWRNHTKTNKVFLPRDINIGGSSCFV